MIDGGKAVSFGVSSPCTSSESPRPCQVRAGHTFSHFWYRRLGGLRGVFQHPPQNWSRKPPVYHEHVMYEHLHGPQVMSILQKNWKVHFWMQREISALPPTLVHAAGNIYSKKLARRLLRWSLAFIITLKLSLRGDKLKEAIAFDKENGYIPFFVSHNFCNSLCMHCCLMFEFVWI